MKKGLKKSLIYLIMTMLVLPTWLVTGMMNVEHAKAASHDKIVINEFVPNPSTGNNEWIELFNEEVTPVNLDGWYIKDNTLAKVCNFGDTDIIPAGGYWKCELTDKLNNSGDVIQLFDNSGSGIAIDSQAYDKDPGIDLSIGRVSDGAPNWIVFDKPSEGSQNLVSQMIPATGTLSLERNQEFQFDITVNPNATYEGATALILSIEKPFSEIFQSLSLTTGSDPEVNVLTDQQEITYGPIGGYNLVYDNQIVTTVKGRTIDSDTAGTFSFGAALYDSTGNILSNIAVYSLTITDSTAPIITLNGDSDLTLNVGDQYSEQGAKVTDNVDTNLTATIGGDIVDTTKIGTYTVTYNATDAAGNNAVEVIRKVRVINKVLAAPVLTFSVSGKTITATWNKVDGAMGYYVYIKSKINGPIVVTDAKASVGADTLTYTNNVSEYGNYYLAIVAFDSFGNVSTIPAADSQAIVAVKAPITVATAQEAPTVVTTEPSTASSTAQVVTPVVTNSNTNADDQGQIKGDETTNEETEKTNWTPWIVLFVLIILAGAATGGYFYWFAGEDEVQAVVKEPKKEEKSEKFETSIKTKQTNNKPNKKAKRW